MEKKVQFIISIHQSLSPFSFSLLEFVRKRKKKWHESSLEQAQRQGIRPMSIYSQADNNAMGPTRGIQ